MPYCAPDSRNAGPGVYSPIRYEQTNPFSAPADDARLLRPPARDSHVFIGAHCGPVTDRTYLKIFHEARAAALTPDEAASPLPDVPYSLRKAAVST